MSRVHIAACASYDTATVEAALRDGLSTLRVDIKPGWRVLLKPNLIGARKPEQAATTHPAIVAAVARWVRDCGATPVIADSPGGRFNERTLRRVYEATGMTLAAAQSSAELNYDTSGTIVTCSQGNRIKMLDVMTAVTTVDAIISLPKLKTHSLTLFTGATKNLFGCIPGVVKAGYHSKLPGSDDFADMLIDVLLHFQPVLTIMDAVVGMEGNGPSGGDPRHLGVLLLGEDGIAIDVVASAMIGLSPRDVTTIAAAARRGLTTGDLSAIELSGTPIDRVAVRDWKRPQARQRIVDMIPAVLRSWLNNQVLVNPHGGQACVRCGVCVENCPARAIRITNGRACMDMARCIRCYCCHELCPHDAVELQQGFIGRLLSRID